MGCLICKAPCRARPRHRPDLRLSNPEPMGGLPFLPTLLILVSIGAVAIFVIWVRTCGMGAAC